MSYRTILVHVNASRHSAARIEIAAQIAVAENAHLIGAAMTGVSRFLYQDNAIDLNQTIAADHIQSLRERADLALAQFDAIAQQVGVLSYEKRLIDDEPAGGLALQARYCDLVVVSQTDPHEPASGALADLPEYVLLNCARPVLVIPHTGQFDQVGTNALIAWDGSMEATRAMAHSIPLLQRAKNVRVAVFNPATQADTHGEEPGADIALYLARHGIKVEVVIEKNRGIDAGQALLSLVADTRSDLMVMGGYGHTRFREVLLGGVTLTVLNAMTVPVLMSH